MHRQKIAEGQTAAWRQVRASLMGASSDLTAEEKTAVKVMKRAGFGEKLRRATIKAVTATIAAAADSITSVDRPIS